MIDKPLIIEAEKNPSNMQPPLVGLIELVDSLLPPNTSGRKKKRLKYVSFSFKGEKLFNHFSFFSRMLMFYQH
jgi:hypothetical protein